MDPHSPENHPNVAQMMWQTKHKYDAFAYRRAEPEPRFEGGYPEWPLIDRLGQSWVARIAWGAAFGVPTLGLFHMRK